MRICKIVIFLLVLHSIECYGQPYSVYGEVRDENSGERLVGANVIDLKNSNGTITDKDGYFNFISTIDSVNLLFTYVGFQSDTLNFVLNSDTMVSIVLNTNNILEEVVVTRSLRKPSTIKLSYREIVNTPSLGGEPDILKVFQGFPGISSGREGSSGIYVRGGGKGENLFLVENVPLYYVNHIGGMVSIFNPEIVNDVELLKGGFNPSYGGRLSSIANITMKEGNKESLRGEITLGIISSKGTIEGPINDRSTYIFSYRRTYLDLFTRLFFPLIMEDVTMGYNFYDLNGKISHRINNRNSLSLFLYQGDDNLMFRYYDRNGTKDKVKTEEKWGNTAISISTKTLLSHRLKLNTELYYLKYRVKDSYSLIFKEPEEYEYNRLFFSGIQDVGTKSSFDLSLSNSYKLSFGWDIKYHLFSQPMVYENYENSASRATSNALETATYINQTIDISPISMRMGLRYVNYSGLIDKNYLEPRLALDLSLTKNLLLFGYYDRMNQFVHNLSSPGNMMNSELFLPVSNNLPPSTMNQICFGVKNFFNKSRVEIEAAVFRKSYTNLIEFKEGEFHQVENANWSRRVESDGVGTAKGLEILVRKKSGYITGFLAYTYSHTSREFTNINNGKAFVYDFDRPHDLNINLSYEITKAININLTWTCQSGLPVTLPLGKYYTFNIDTDLNDELYEAFVYSQKNEYRMRTYHRLDVGINYIIKKKEKLRQWSLSIYNLYNRHNPYYLYTESSPEKEMTVYEQSFFPIIPMVSYQIRF